MAQYELRHSFSQHEKEVLQYIRSVDFNSLQYYKEYCRINNVSLSLFELECVQDTIEYLEDYLYYFDHFYPEQFEFVFSILRI